MHCGLSGRPSSLEPSVGRSADSRVPVAAVITVATGERLLTGAGGSGGGGGGGSAPASSDQQLRNELRDVTSVRSTEVVRRLDCREAGVGVDPRGRPVSLTEGRPGD